MRSATMRSATMRSITMRSVNKRSGTKRSGTQRSNTKRSSCIWYEEKHYYSRLDIYSWSLIEKRTTVLQFSVYPSREDSSSAALVANRAKEIKKMILGKMRRSNSGNLQDEKKKKEKMARASEDPSLLTRGGFNRLTDSTYVMALLVIVHAY